VDKAVDFFKTLPFNGYLIGGCAVLLVLALVLYYVPGGRIKIPAIAGCILFSLAGGIGVGVVAMYGMGYHWEREPQTGMGKSPFAKGGGPPDGGGGEKKGGEGGPKKGGEGGPGKKGDGKKADQGDKEPAEKKGKKGGGGGDMMEGMQAAGRSMMANPPGPSYKDRLVSLVIKLDVLTGKTPLVKLTDDQKAKIQEKLKALDKEEITDEQAEKILVEFLEIVEDQRKALEEVGFQYPGAGGAIPRPVPNPFKYKANADHLKSLQEHLGEKGNKSGQ